MFILTDKILRSELTILHQFYLTKKVIQLQVIFVGGLFVQQLHISAYGSPYQHCHCFYHLIVELVKADQGNKLRKTKNKNWASHPFFLTSKPLKLWKSIQAKPVIMTKVPEQQEQSNTR